MGWSTKTLARIMDLKGSGHIGPGSRMLELGTQNLICSGGAADLVQFFEFINGEPPAFSDEQLSGLANGGLISRIMQHCRIEYLALDISDYEATMLFDLNKDKTPTEMVGQFDIVTNMGTTEHLIGQFNAMKVIHEFTKTGGIIYHDLPMGGYHYHGYFSYNPLFFNHLAIANGYEILFRHFSKIPATAPYVQVANEELRLGGWPDEGFHNAGIEYIFRKTKDMPFRVPIEVHTSHAVNREFLFSRDADISILSGMDSDK